MVLIISPWNYPINLSLSPLIGAIACGNCVILKPSEYAPHCASVLAKIVQSAFESTQVAIVQGDSTIGASLLEQKFDYIFFTGSVNVGRIVLQEAAKKLTPATLELGGKNPCIIQDYKDSVTTAKRIMWAKLLNAGQTCTAPDYLLVRETLKEELIAQLIESMTSLYAPHALKQSESELQISILNNQEYGKIISHRHFERIISLFEDTKRILGQDCVIFGGKSDEKALKIAPTLLDMGNIRDYISKPDSINPKRDMRILHEEIFAPILPVFTYHDLSECRAFIQSFEKPLSLYIFSDDKCKQREFIESVSFGGGCVNDCIIHLANNHLPFGGVGNSGMGSYHGRHSAKTFARKKAIYTAPHFDLPLRYPPFSKKLFGLNRLTILRKIFGV